MESDPDRSRPGSTPSAAASLRSVPKWDARSCRSRSPKPSSGLPQLRSQPRLRPHLPLAEGRKPAPAPLLSVLDPALYHAPTLPQM